MGYMADLLTRHRIWMELNSAAAVQASSTPA